jgi:two-component system nitrate/nitrite response regulator NarL
MKKLLIADDHEMFRDGLTSLLQSNSDWSVVKKVSNGEEVLKALEFESFDLILLDINMPVMNGITALEIIRDKFPDLKVIMLSMFNDIKNIQKVIKSGAHGYLLKDSSKKDLFEGITTVLDGGTFFVDKVKEILINGLRSSETLLEVKLTEREKEILSLICQEMTTQQIAQHLQISTYTVETYRKNLLSKTGVKNSIGLLKFAIENNLV